MFYANIDVMAILPGPKKERPRPCSQYFRLIENVFGSLDAINFTSTADDNNYSINTSDVCNIRMQLVR